MAETIRLNKVLRELNISLDRAVEFLDSKGIEIEKRPTTKISEETYNVLSDEFETDANKKMKSQEVSEAKLKEKEDLRIKREKELEEKQKAQEAVQKSEVVKAASTLSGPKTVGKIDLEPKKKVVVEAKEEKPVAEEKPIAKKEVVEKPVNKKEEPAKVEEKKLVAKKEEVKPEKKETPKKIVVDDELVTPDEQVKTQYQKLTGPKIAGDKIDLSQFNKPKKKKEEKKEGGASTGNANKKKRRRISKAGPSGGQGGNNQRGGNRNNDRFKGKGRRNVVKEEPSEEDVKKQVRETLEKLQGKSSKGKGAKYRREKRDQHRDQTEKELQAEAAESKILKVTEFVTASEVATMMNVGVTEIISACMSLGMMVTMNQRLDAETLSIVAEEFGYQVEFVTADIEESIVEDEDNPEDLKARAPIVTVMGHVDHGKTSLLDYIREENVIAGESGGITQHIGAYGVTLDSGQKIAFLDTPGHEAFTAMRARGAQVTDIAIIVAAADDDIMPQTKEAISHAQAAGVPIVFAINKIDLPAANPEKIKEGLANMNLLVEDWGGKIQSHDISAKMGTGVKELLEKVLLEAELLELKANPDKPAVGTVVEAFLDKGRGYVSTILVQAGTLRVGDYVLAGQHSGKVKAMHDERGNDIEAAGPSTPVSILGLDGAPQAGDKFNVFEDEREAKQIAAKRSQLQREQSVRTQRHITLDEIGRRIALGDFQELNIILKGDVDGSVEALTDSFQKLSTEEIQVNILHKGVGAITESDVLLASASDAIIVGFNVRPVGNARDIADKEEIDIRTYSIIYDAINDLKDAMEGMLSPELKEEVTGTAEIRQVFKVSKIGSIAGCMVTNGKIFRNSGVRLIRDGVVVHTGELTSLKRFKDDVKEVSKGYDCGMQVKNYNDIKEGDIIEAFHEVEVKKKLK
ncbi:translation initiation factor IF-2 [Hyunsoonleella pacifica]|uniref:Translation initiation factor IF-2 n=1 Tax=Hyunsoonleella pacifica TaxID=1080224 RepID=A0A4Q9FNP4_9FLAO|nr:translation initiation factor IF-2 [Hyunsoonleella pacifica]TBN16490.1 translation initiation factor IF-2 [Hyunsoonleella pacifica]GGD18944.1 translation initiation factor IF-2 [Hyunsoonleella pacifica]